jgi:dipeptidyl aminopeptidase/acylaminoacyl peptidase
MLVYCWKDFRYQCGGKAMKRLILRNIVLVLTVLIMIALTILCTITAHGATPTSVVLTISPTRTFVTPSVSPTAPNSKQLATTAPTQAATRLAVNSSDGRVPRIAFIANRNGAANIYAMDPDGKNIVQLTNSRDYKLFPTWSPNGKLIAYLIGIAAGLPPKLMVMNANGSNPHQINIGKAIAISPPTWSPDSTQIAYISVRSRPTDSGLYIIDVTGNREQKLKISIPINFSYTPPADNIALTDAFAPSWSPDGKTILLFGGLGTAEKTTLLVTLDGKTVRPFLDFGADFNFLLMNPDCVPADSHCVGTDASWSSDGTQVLFVGLESSGQQFTRVSIDVADASGAVLTELPSNDKMMAYFPTWSPDGKQIVFAGISFTTKLERIYVMNADGSDVRQLTEDTISRGDSWPSWEMVPTELVKH